jgi:Flp pilus assembly protein TadD
VRLGQQRPAEAAAAARAAIELEPQAAALHNLLGAALLAAGDVARAEAAFRDAARLGDRDAAGNLGICAWRNGDPRAAIAVWLELLARDPQDAAARSHLEAVRAALATV